MSAAARITFVDKAERAWSPAPAWVRRLAEETDRHGQTQVAKRIAYSTATVSQVLSACYRGDIAKVEQRVLGALMGETVICPVKGDMRRNVCLDWQDKPYAPTSSDRARMYHACRSGCPHSKHTKEALS